MKFALLLVLAISSTAVMAGESMLSSQEDCLSGEPKNVVIYEKMKKLDDGSYWIKNVHLKSGSQFVRIKDSEKNKKRICQKLGFTSAGGSRVEFEKGETVVGINNKLEVKKIKAPESKFILNVNCH